MRIIQTKNYPQQSSHKISSYNVPIPHNAYYLQILRKKLNLLSKHKAWVFTHTSIFILMLRKHCKIPSLLHWTLQWPETPFLHWTRSFCTSAFYLLHAKFGNQKHHVGRRGSIIILPSAQNLGIRTLTFDRTVQPLICLLHFHFLSFDLGISESKI